jgi:DNA processing protein
MTAGRDIRACDACLRRTWLLGRLAGRLEIAVRRRERLPEVLALSDAELVAALAPDSRDRLLAELERFDADRARGRVRAAGLSANCRHDEGYPAVLNDLGDQPAVLHVRGETGALERFDPEAAVAIVGARRASSYGLEVARALGRGLASAGITVVSGMALGVDSAAHAGALEVGGPTVAVLGSGADVPYPATKRTLYRRIAASGCVVSEMPPGTGAWRWCFPARNRIIAALARATVVVEAGERSGSLITAHLAQQLGRDVCAVPGQVTAAGAAGANALLFDGAALVRDAQDVLDRVLGAGAVMVARPDGRELAPPLRRLLEAVSNGRDTLAALATPEGNLQEALVGLAELELQGYVRRGPGGRYALTA